MSVRSFSVVYEAGAPNTQVQNLNSGLYLGVGGQVVDQFGRNIYSVVGYTPTDFSTLNAAATSLMTSANLGQAGSDDDANLLTLPIGAKVVGLNIIATTAIVGTVGASTLAVQVGARNTSGGDVIAAAAVYDTVWVLDVTGNTCQVGSVGSLIGSAGTATSGGVPQAGVTSGNQFVNLVNANGTFTGGALQVVVQYVLP